MVDKSYKSFFVAFHNSLWQGISKLSVSSLAIFKYFFHVLALADIANTTLDNFLMVNMVYIAHELCVNAPSVICSQHQIITIYISRPL
jgi:hypothetical protein